MEVNARGKALVQRNASKGTSSCPVTYCANNVQGEESPCVLRKSVMVSYDSRHL